ncbi:hypothetical protein JCM12141A_54910 [Mycolicibacterium hodleri]
MSGTEAFVAGALVMAIALLDGGEDSPEELHPPNKNVVTAARTAVVAAARMGTASRSRSVLRDR